MHEKWSNFKADTPGSTMWIKYEDFFTQGVQGALNSFLGYSLKYPTQRACKSSWESHEKAESLRETYKGLVNEIAELPSFKII